MGVSASVTPWCREKVVVYYTLWSIVALHHLTTSSCPTYPHGSPRPEAVDGLPNYIARDDLLQVASLGISDFYRRTFIPLSVSFWNDLVDLVFDSVGLAGFKSSCNAFLLS